VRGFTVRGTVGVDKEAIYTGRTHAQARDDCSIKMDEK
jgi:hypothetical protein